MPPTTVRRLVAAALVVAAGICAFLALQPDDVPAARRAAPRLMTPLWSPRRVPQPLVDAVGAQRLQSQLGAELGPGQACVVVDDGAGTLAARNPDLALAPASTEKLLTAVGVLTTLGPAFRYETRALAPTAPNGGTVERLWIVGSGDPGLSTPEFQAFLAGERATKDAVTTPLAALADSIVASGVKRITGGVQGDDSRYEALRYLPTWKDSYRTEGQVGPLGALTVNHGFSAVKPKPVPVDDPAVFAASELTRLLVARGVAVGGSPGRAAAPPNANAVGSVQSPQLHDLVASFLRTSDNLAAELFTRELGVRAAQQGTTAAGTKVLGTTLGRMRLPTSGLTLVDGSGLDRGDRVTCALLLDTLGLGERPQLKAMWDGLAVAGQTGTLEDELRGSPLDGKLRAKTGSLQGVTGLVGLLDVGRPLRFAFVANGDFDEKGGVALRARVALIVSRFPDSPPADRLVPAPS
jgi:D-alanyl-D-alanine carboxypeptidase/D-alanyl-D-alanine-endopeptidase (penicillin-binding protein 4)